MKKQVLEFPVGTYKGEVKNNLPHGKGVMNFKNGDKYEGYFLKGLRHGKGKDEFHTGDKYIGNYK